MNGEATVLFKKNMISDILVFESRVLRIIFGNNRDEVTGE
jgi:hypothetical protein